MEILSQTTHWDVYVFLLALVGIMVLASLYLVILTISDCIRYGRNVDGISIALSVLSLVLVGITTMALVVIVKDGPDVTYQAKITDFNEVYNNGYEIVEQDGKLFTIRKEAK